MTREEAINKVRQMSLPKETMEILEALAPELAESEDERNWKIVMEYVKDDALRAWLEKQKAQKQEKFPLYVTGFKGDPDPAGTSDLEEAAKEYASKTLCDPDDGPSTGLAKESFIAGAEWQKEQKPAEWSEEDEKDMAHIIRILNDCYVYGTHDLSKTDHENLVNKLKSLRPQYHGDVTMTEAYKMGLEAGKASSWKPSQEQLYALLNAEGFLRAGLQHDSAKTIADLYEQLKRL